MKGFWRVDRKAGGMAGKTIRGKRQERGKSGSGLETERREDGWEHWEGYRRLS